MTGPDWQSRSLRIHKTKTGKCDPHPLTWNAVLTEAYSCGSERVVIETALPSKEFRDKCDEMWYLYTSEENRISRLMESRGYSLEKSMAIMESQASDEEFRALADAVIDNNHSQECTAAQVRGAAARTGRNRYMRMVSIESGSSGNCIYIGSDQTHILVDAGISNKRIMAGLK